MTYDVGKLRDELVADEAYRFEPYLDCCGRPPARCACESKGNLTGGIGHLMTKRLTPEVIDLWFADDVDEAEHALDVLLPRWRELADDMQRALVNLAFNLGQSRLAEFKRFLAAMREHIVTPSEDALGRARNELTTSLAARQTGKRYERIAERLRT